MVSNTFLKKLFVDVVTCLYIILFAYAAVSKLTDFENFKIQIAQSILLTAFASPISYAVIIIELIIAIMLIIPKSKLLGLFAGYSLMILFTVYIFIMLNYSPHIPCSCGGILEKMNWTQHIIFNGVFVILAFFAILMTNGSKTKNLIALFITATISIAIMIVLFLASDDIVRKRNNFTRKLIPFGIKESAELDLKFNSYYFAGAGNNKIYLGNNTAPSIMTIVNDNLQNTEIQKIVLSDTSMAFSAIRIKVSPPNFYVFDGTVPSIHTGNTSSWNATLKLKDIQSFDLAEGVNESRVVFRAPTKKFGNILGTFNLPNSAPVAFNKELLQKQADGFFDTDGTLLYNATNKSAIYIYYYRNEYIVADDNLNLIHRGNTIDTTSIANLKVVTQDKKGQKILGAPAQIVNRLCATNKNLLFINSMLPGKIEPLEMWDHASIIDIYDFTKKEYLASIYVYANNGKKMSSFIVTNTHLFALFENNLIAYKFSDELKKIIND